MIGMCHQPYMGRAFLGVWSSVINYEGSEHVLQFPPFYIPLSFIIDLWWTVPAYYLCENQV
jgi:hypothetical protein